MKKAHKIAACVGAAAVCAATGGLAAPVIGGVIGSTMGLSGAAATSAGLAALGGGALTTGGLGMAGGTALISTVAGSVGAGAVAIATKRKKKK